MAATSIDAQKVHAVAVSDRQGGAAAQKHQGDSAECQLSLRRRQPAIALMLDVLVVGGGPAGLAAAHAILQTRCGSCGPGRKLHRPRGIDTEELLVLRDGCST